ncbi:hypothetical protein N665_0288s0007 [Sinapis alba]|nr:hypothetical protein N665_0288s0007 [Sinapis alba]
MVSKLRHRNLTRILGCFVELLEKMLIYTFIFDEEHRLPLELPKRIYIFQRKREGRLVP